MYYFRKWDGNKIRTTLHVCELDYMDRVERDSLKSEWDQLPSFDSLRLAGVFSGEIFIESITIEVRYLGQQYRNFPSTFHKIKLTLSENPLEFREFSLSHFQLECCMNCISKKSNEPILVWQKEGF